MRRHNRVAFAAYVSRIAATLLSQQLDLLFDAYRVDERVSAKARSIRVEVHSATEVRLVIPRFVPKLVAREFLRSREAWIRQKIAELKLRQAESPEAPTPQLRWDGSDLLPLRGVDLPLRVIPAQVRLPKVRFDDGISLFCHPTLLAQPRKLERCLRDVLKHQALQDADRLLRDEGARLGVQWSGPRVADQKTLWGSCAASGLISLSWRLVMAPPQTFRYVVIHELCHLRHHDHSDRFWALVARQMPDFELHRRWLREHGHRLHWWLAG